MVIGVRAHDYGRDTPNGLFGRIRADGFDAVQLAIPKAIAGVTGVNDITDGIVTEIAESLQAYRLFPAVLGAYVEPSLPDEAQRKKNVTEFLTCLPVAKRLGAGCIGTETTSMEKQHALRRDAYAMLLRSLYEIMPAAETLGVIVAVEPVYYHTLDTPELAAELLREISSPNLRIIFDPVNLLRPEDVPSQRGLWDRAFEAFGGKIAAVHIKGMRAGGDGRPESTSLAGSAVDYAYIFSLLKSQEGDIPVLREEARPQTAKEDITFLQSLIRQG